MTEAARFSTREVRVELVVRELNSDWLSSIVAEREAKVPAQPAVLAATAPVTA